MTREVVELLANTYAELEGEPLSFHDAVEDAVGENAQVLYWYHPNLETFLPVIVVDESKLVWDIAHELTKRWNPKPTATRRE
jgi:hypothetical protein